VSDARRSAHARAPRPRVTTAQRLRATATQRIAAALRPDAPSLEPAPALRPARKSPHDLARELRRRLLRYRRLVIAGCAGLAVMTGLSALAPRRPASVAVVAAAHDIASGTILKAADVRLVTLPVHAVPAGALTAGSTAVGRTAAGPIRRGEPITDVRLAGGPLAPPGDGLVAAPVRLADPEAARLLQVGQHIDVLASLTSASADVTVGAATVVAADVSVVAIPTASADASGEVGAPGLDGALVVLATTPDQARALAQAEVSERLSAVVVR
jgi:Flp pilus assembly protein CpaB